MQVLDTPVSERDAVIILPPRAGGAVGGHGGAAGEA
jgi:hypothetical protein